MFKPLEDIILGKKILILGFGREGKALFAFLRKKYPKQVIWIADRNVDLKAIQLIDPSFDNQIICGDRYLDNLRDFELVVKTPGIPLTAIEGKMDMTKLTSQTNLFLKLFRNQVIGITGTKGKSTTSSLIYHIIKQFTDNVVLVGNIGVPPFEVIEQLNPSTKIVFELSSHQLESVDVSPHISILLNIYQEHLDHYKSFFDYQKAKYKIAQFQLPGDYFIYNNEDERIAELMRMMPLKSTALGFGYGYHTTSSAWFEKEDAIIKPQIDAVPLTIHKTTGIQLKGNHNLLNAMAAVLAVKTLGIPDQLVLKAVASFKGLEHRIEYVGCYSQRHFYNDSISTIPESSMLAIKALGRVDTLILGGKDRGIDYDPLVQHLIHNPIQGLVFTGNAGQRMMDHLQEAGYKGLMLFFQEFDAMVEYAKSITPIDGVCLLSPAASSYDRFINFEERGKRFKMLVSV
jgi:UDP-N-acetylmuramoylalanine--D-glutamate ligase